MKFYILLVLVVLFPAVLGRLQFWEPAQYSTLFFGDEVAVAWACSDGDASCLRGLFAVELWQQSSSGPGKFIAAIGNGNVDGSFIWTVPETISPGEAFYLVSSNSSTRLQEPSGEFYVKHSGCDIISPSAATVWVPNSHASITWTPSKLFSSLDKNAVVRVSATWNPSINFVVGSAQIDARKILLDTSTLPWGTIQSGYYVAKLEIAGASTSPSSEPFIISHNSTASCDIVSLSAMFSDESYGEVSSSRVYDSCGLEWKTEWSYSQGDNGVLVVSSADAKVAFVAFRGTVMSLNDWINNLSLKPIACDWLLADGCNGGYLHSGFAKSFNATKTTVRAVASSLLSNGFRVILTGHSKGAAIATIQAADLLQTAAQAYASNLAVLTFGTPRVGDKQFMDLSNRLLNAVPPCFRSVRFVTESASSGKDPVSQLPPKGMFEHVGRAVYVRCPSAAVNDIEKAGLGVAVDCHPMSKYIQAVVVNGEGHESC